MRKGLSTIIVLAVVLLPISFLYTAQADEATSTSDVSLTADALSTTDVSDAQVESQTEDKIPEVVDEAIEAPSLEPELETEVATSTENIEASTTPEEINPLGGETSKSEEIIVEPKPEYVPTIPTTLTTLPENQLDWTGSDDPAFVIDEHFFSTELVPVSVTGPDEIFLPTQAVTEFPQENIQNENLISNALSAFTGFMRMLFDVRLAKADSLPEASVLNSLGEIDKNIVPLIAMIDGKTVIKLDRGRAFRPGAYTLAVNYENKIIKRDFTWGVLAINTNKAAYTSGEEAYIQMASLNKHGHTLCNSKLELQITNITNGSNSQTNTFTTDPSTKLGASGSIT